MLTNKLNDKELANLLEILIENSIKDAKSMCNEEDDFKVDLREEDEREDGEG